MFTVEIAYKSGKVEKVDIKISKYSEALRSLAQEGRTLSAKIIGVK